MEQRRWHLLPVAIPIAVLVVSFVGCAKHPSTAQMSAPSPMGSSAISGSPNGSGNGSGPSPGSSGDSVADGSAAAAANSGGRASGATGTSGGSDSSAAHGSPEGNDWSANGGGARGGGAGRQTGASGSASGGAAGDRSGAREGAGGEAGLVQAAVSGVTAGRGASGEGDAGQAGTSSDGAMLAAARPSLAEFSEGPGLADVHFDFDRYDIRPQDATTLATNADWLKSNPDTLLLIEGHCDERGTNEYNLALGEHRAKSTMNYLVAQGVRASRITIISYGEERPRCTEHAEACWGENRRSHLLVKSR